MFELLPMLKPFLSQLLLSTQEGERASEVESNGEGEMESRGQAGEIKARTISLLL